MLGFYMATMSSGGAAGDFENIVVPMMGDDAGEDDDMVSVEIDDEDPVVAPAGEGGGFYDNLVSHFTQGQLSGIASSLMEGVDADERSMQEWRDTLKRGLETLGLKKIPTANLAFDGASTGSFPLLMEAVIQFNARAMKETLPADGAVKCKVYGKETEEAAEKAAHVEKHMNAQILFEDSGYFDNHDKLLMYLPFAGSAFKKTYRDTVKGITVSRFIPADNITVNYHATCDEDLERITHTTTVTHQAYKRMVGVGELSEHHGALQDSEVANEDDLTDSVMRIEGRDKVVSNDDGSHTLREVNCYYDMPNFEHKDAEGNKTGIALPWIVTIDKESQKVLSIRRNWEENGNQFVRLDYITHYRYLQGFGYLGWGLLHVIGNPAETVNGLLRLTIDGGMVASFNGGFTAKTMKMKNGSYQLRPFHWQSTDLDPEELQKAFYTPPFKDPSPVISSIFTTLVEAGRRIASTTETMVGDANNNAPVGTTIALIEQATKVMSGIHVRLHNAMAHEFMVRARINAQYLAEEGLVFDANGDTGFIVPADYDGSFKLVPVSDPNVVSQTQRIAVAQGQLALAQQFPQYHDMYEALKRMHSAVGTPDIDDILINPEDAPYVSPVIEGARVVAGKPIKAYFEQDHKAHNAVHGAQMEYITRTMGEQGNNLLLALQAHIAEHTAYDMYLTMGGVKPFDLSATDKEEASQDKQVERIQSAQEAQQVAQLMQMILEQFPPQEDKEAEKQTAFAAEEQRKAQSFEAEEARKQDSYEREQARKDGSMEDTVVSKIHDEAINRAQGAIAQAQAQEQL